MKAPKFREFISEEIQRSDIQIAILSKINADSKSVVSNMILAECKKRNIPCYLIDTSEAWVSKNDLEKGTLTISNIDGEDTQAEFDLSKTICFTRAGVLMTPDPTSNANSSNDLYDSSLDNFSNGVFIFSLLTNLFIISMPLSILNVFSSFLNHCLILNLDLFVLT